MRGVAALVLAGVAGAGGAACGSIDTGALFVGDTTGAGGGTTATGTTSSSGVLPTCGNGQRDPGEACDGADVNGATCQTEGFSQPGKVTCTAACALDTSACKATCDGQKLEPTEPCDGTFLGAHTCTEFGYANPAGLTCNNCQLDPSTCMAMCGNGQKEPGETCDGASLGGKSCTDYGYATPAGLACTPDCMGYDPSGCMAVCGNDVLEMGEVCDTSKLDGHSCTEFGYSNPDGLKCKNCMLDPSSCKATCGNGVVEPGEACDDGNTKSGDGCSNKCQIEGTGCTSAVNVNVNMGTQAFDGTTDGGGSHTGQSCQGSDATDRVYALSIKANGFLTASLSRAQTNFDSVLYIATSCGDNVNPLLCADSYDVANNTSLNGGEVLSLRVQQGQTYYLFVDGFGMMDTGNYHLVINLSTGLDCANAVPIPLEPGAPMTLLGSNTGIPPLAAGSCGGSLAGQVIYNITRPDDGSLTIETDTNLTSYNAVLYARQNCVTPTPELGCSNNSGTSQESITIDNVMGGTAIPVYVDGSSTGGSTPSGNYGIIVTP